MKNNSKKGFTIVELLAVVVVIAIISLVAVAAVFSIMKKAREKQYETNIDSMGTAVRLFGDDAKNGLSNINNALVYKDSTGKTWKVGCKKDGISKKCCVNMGTLRDMGYLKVTDDDMCADNTPCMNYNANITYSGNSVMVELTENAEDCEIIKFKVLYHSVEKINSGDEDTVESYCEYNKPCKIRITPNEFHTKYPGHTVINWEDRRGNLYETNSEVDLTLKTTTDVFDLFANWKNNEFTFTYYGNTSTSGSMTPSHHTYQDGSSLKANAFQKIGYSYLYWNDKADGTGRKYENREPVSENTFDDGTNIKLYAQWKPNNYGVTFDANNGTGLSFSSKTVTFDSPYGDLPTVSRVGYTFKGWYTALTGGTKITESTIVKTPNNHTLYARWEANKYTVTFNGNTGNTPVPTTKTVTYDQKYGTLAIVTKTGYTFKGWWTAASGGTQITADTIVKITAPQTLYAHWQANTYTITFEGNGGNTPNPTTKTVTFDSTYGTLATVTRTGYTFAGWWSAASGGTKIETSTIVKTASNHTIYAHWTPNTYTISLTSTLATTAGTSSVIATYDSANLSIAITKPSRVYTITFKSGTPTATFSPSSRTSTWTFDGWYTSASGGTKVIDASGKLVANANGYTNASRQWVRAGGATLYAHWTGGTISVPTPTRTGYSCTFGTVTNPPTANATYTSTCTDNENPKITCTKSNTGTTSGVTITCTCTDNGSGVVQCAGKTVTATASTSETKTGIKSSTTYTVKDASGKTASTTVTVTPQVQTRTKSCSTGKRCTSAGCETWKSCTHSECGVSSYKTCRTSGCGCETYKRCSAAGCETYKSCAHSECGVSSYKTCRTSGCGCQTYKRCSSAGCQTANTCTKSCCGNTTSTYSGTSPSCGSGCSNMGGAASLGSGMYRWSCTCPKTCTSSSCCGCATYNRGSSCGCETYNSCAHSECGVSSYKTCRTSGCGCETYKRGSSCGCETWKSCAHSECGVSSYKTCRTSGCGCETYKRSASTCGCETWGSFGSWSNAGSCTAGESSDHGTIRECRTVYN